MAAGVGSRINGAMGDIPKCLIKADGQTLIGKVVKTLNDSNIDDVTVITGYKSDLVEQELGEGVDYIHNPFYRVTNSIASLWLARDLLSEEVILMNADLFFEKKVLDIMLAQTKDAVMLSDKTRIEDADFRFGVNGNRIIKSGNTLTNYETDCEYVGISRIGADFVTRFKTRLEHMVKCGDFKNWWEGVLYSFIEDGLNIYHKDVDGAFWIEIDHMEDYQRLNRWISENAAITP